MKLMNFLSDTKYKNNKTGINGLHFDSRDNIWCCQIQINKKRYRKSFKQKEDALNYLEEIKNSIK